MLAIVKAAAKQFIRDKAMAFSAALAYYTALSFAPLVLLLVTVGSFLGPGASEDLIQFFENQVGSQAGTITESVVENGAPDAEESGVFRVVLGVVLLLFAASGVFAQLQAALNYIWEVEPKPGQGLWGWVRKRLLSIGMVFALLFILLVALVLSSAIEHLVPENNELGARVTSIAVSLVVFTALFATIYKVLPDAEIAWGSVWLGALVTAIMFLIGKVAISLYLERGSATQSYGDAAGSLIALLIWVYFSGIIFFFGAEITQQHAIRRGDGMQPSRHAQLSPRANTPDAVHQQANET